MLYRLVASVYKTSIHEYTRVFNHNLSIAVPSNKGSRKTLAYHT